MELLLTPEKVTCSELATTVVFKDDDWNGLTVEKMSILVNELMDAYQDKSDVLVILIEAEPLLSDRENYIAHQCRLRTREPRICRGCGRPM